MKKKKTCKICGKTNVRVVYDGFIRDGQWGNVSKEKFKVLHCDSCDARYLEKLPFDQSAFYQSKEYRKSYTGSSKPKKFKELYGSVQDERVSRIGLDKFRNKIVADFGAGAGTFLDKVYKVAKETIAIEPAGFYKNWIERKHAYYPYGSKFLASGKKADVAVSFEVIEHVEKPLEYLREIRDSLKKGGRLFLSSVNHDNIYNDLIKEDFDPFNYRTAHLYYLTKKSMDYLLKKAGFRRIKTGFYHDYDLSNLIVWLKEKRPSGTNAIPIFSEESNKSYKKDLERCGKAMSLWVEAVK